MVKTPPPTGLMAQARAAARSSTSKSTTTTGASSRSSSSGNFSSDNDEEINRHFDYNDNDDIDDNEIQEVPAPVTKTPHPVEVATLADVVVAKLEEDEPLSLVKKEVRGQQTYRTRIRSIAGHNMTGITLTIIRRFCILNKIKGTDGKSLRSEPKNVCCERIIQYIDNPDAATTALTKTKIKSTLTSITMTKSKGCSKFKPKKKSDKNKNQAEFNAIYKASIDCRKEEINCRKEKLAMKKQAMTIQSMAVMSQELERKETIIEKRKHELLEAVIEADGLQNLTPKTQRKRAKKAMKKRIKRHGQWKAQYGNVDSDDEDVASQDTCESKVDRFEDAQQSVTETQEALANLRKQADEYYSKSPAPPTAEDGDNEE